MPCMRCRQQLVPCLPVRLRAEFDTYSDGLFSLPVNLPGTTFAKALRAREVIVGQIAELVRAAQASKAAGEKLHPRRRNSLQLLLDAQDENGEKVGCMASHASSLHHT